MRNQSSIRENEASRKLVWRPRQVHIVKHPPVILKGRFYFILSSYAYNVPSILMTMVEVIIDDLLIKTKKWMKVSNKHNHRLIAVNICVPVVLNGSYWLSGVLGHRRYIIRMCKDTREIGVTYYGVMLTRGCSVLRKFSFIPNIQRLMMTKYTYQTFWGWPNGIIKMP